MTDNIRSKIAAWVDSEYGSCPVAGTQLLAFIDSQQAKVAELKAERDELLKLINRRKIHPHDFPLEIFIADLSTRTANVLRAEFDSFRHTDGTYDIEPPFTVRHLLMFSRQEIKKWPGIGKKGLNEIEENLRARGLQLWHAHDDRSLRLLREHKSYFVDPAKAKGVAA